MAFIREARELVLRRGAVAVLTLLLAMVCAAAQERAPAVADPSTPEAPAPSAVAALSRANDLQGLRVAQVEFRGIEANPPVLENLRRLVAPNLDQPLDRQKLGRTVRALYATGRFADVQVDAQRNQRNELSLVFIATENLFIGSITVVGAPRRPSAAQLRDATKLELGKPYSPAAVEQGMERMKSLLVDNGYYQSAITVNEERHPESQQINVHFSVTPGQAAKIGQVIVTGSPGLSDAEILRISKLQPGATVSVEKVRWG